VNKVGFVISLVGGVLAILFSVLLIITGPVLYAWDDVYDFISDNKADLGKIWTYLGEYNGAAPFLQSDLGDYVDNYTQILQNVDASELEKIGEKYDIEAYRDLAGIYKDFESYLPKLWLGVIACLVASVIALAGAELAKNYRIAGGSMVLSGAALTLIFSLVASSIVPMALASVLLILGGVFQIVKTKAHAAVQGEELAKAGERVLS
jgi:hypothetical protein